MNGEKQRFLSVISGKYGKFVSVISGKYGERTLKTIDWGISAVGCQCRTDCS